MLPGFAASSAIFSPHHSESGLAHFLASQGFDVFVGELRGKGASWPQVSRHSNWGVHELISEDIPALLNRVADLRPGVAQLWLGEGLGSQLLVGAYGRQQALPAPVVGMAHFSAARRCELSTLPKALLYTGWQTYCLLISKLMGSVAVHSGQAESCGVWKNICHWHHSDQWKDPLDDFNYRVAVRHYGLPPSIYFNSTRSSLWGSISDTRLWIEELGEHDAQLISVSKKNGNLHNYSRRELLLHPQASNDHFQTLLTWLDSKTAR